MEIRVQDYRDLRGERFDAISSIGMFEHVGKARTARYFETLRDLLVPDGQVAQPRHLRGRRLEDPAVDASSAATSSPTASSWTSATWSLAMERAGFECPRRRVAARALRTDLARLGRQPGRPTGTQAVSVVASPGPGIWRLYMAASVVGFENAGIAVHQVLGVVPDRGRSGMPPTRAAWG